MSVAAAQKTWELQNGVSIVDPTKDFIYGYDAEEQKAILAAQPWKKE